MKRILVPTDFSEQAENALKVAAQLAKKNNIPITPQIKNEFINDKSKNINVFDISFFLNRL